MGHTAEAKLAIADAEAILDVVGTLPVWDDVAIERTRGDMACRTGDYNTATEGATLALSAHLSDAGRARMCNQLGIAAVSLGDIAAAADAFQQELDAVRRLGDPGWEAWALGNLAEVELRRGARAEAAAHQRACLALALQLGSPAKVAFSIIVAARLLAAGEGWQEAVALHARAEAILEGLGLVLFEDDQRESDVMLEEARRALGDGRYGASRRAGRALELPEAAAQADAVLEEAADAQRGTRFEDDGGRGSP